MGIVVADEEHDPLSARPLLPAAPSTSYLSLKGAFQVNVGLATVRTSALQISR